MENLNLENTSLTDEELSVFLGNLLGDGHIQKRQNSYRSKISHGFQQKDYVFWKYEKLKRLCENNHPPKVVYSKTQNPQVLFYLQSGKYLEKYHQLFYQPYLWKASTLSAESSNFSGSRKRIFQEKIKYRKTITPTLIENLPKTSLLLAVWFLDDGSCRQDVFSGRIASQGFSKEEQHLLQDFLKSNFGIPTQMVIHSRLKKQYYISIPSKSFPNLVNLIKPWVEEVPSLHYKINPRSEKRRKKTSTAPSAGKSPRND